MPTLLVTRNAKTTNSHPIPTDYLVAAKSNPASSRSACIESPMTTVRIAAMLALICLPFAIGLPIVAAEAGTENQLEHHAFRSTQTVNGVNLTFRLGGEQSHNTGKNYQLTLINTGRRPIWIPSVFQGGDTNEHVDIQARLENLDGSQAQAESPQGLRPELRHKSPFTVRTDFRPGNQSTHRTGLSYVKPKESCVYDYHIWINVDPTHVHLQPGAYTLVFDFDFKPIPETARKEILSKEIPYENFWVGQLMTLEREREIERKNAAAERRFWRKEGRSPIFSGSFSLRIPMVRTGPGFEPDPELAQQSDAILVCMFATEQSKDLEDGTRQVTVEIPEVSCFVKGTPSESLTFYTQAPRPDGTSMERGSFLYLAKGKDGKLWQIVD